jgi:CheY-like chemotaxis protein
VSGLNVTNVSGQPAQARGAAKAEFTTIGFGHHRSPPLETRPRRRIGDEPAVSMRDEDGVDSGPTRTLLLIDDVRLRRECLFHLLSAELPDFNVLAVAPAEPLETWTAASPDVILVNAPASGPRQTGEIVAAANGAPVLLLTESGGDAQAADEPGIAGRFPTACGTSLLIAAIQLVLAGGRFQIPVGRVAATTSRPNNHAIR